MVVVVVMLVVMVMVVEVKANLETGFLQRVLHMTSYMAELIGSGTRIANVRHFPLTESSDGIVDWAADSKAVINISNRTGEYGLYRQDLNETTEALVTAGYTQNPRVTPDGKWILYFGAGDTSEPLETRPQPVIRVPLNGGPPQMLFTARAWSLMQCARAPSELCVIAEPSEDRKQLIVTALDAMKGRGPELMRFPLDPNDNRWCLGVSADGTRIAVTRTPASPIYVFSVHGRPVQEIKVKNWSNLLIFTWAINGKGLFLVEGIRSGRVLLYVDLQGNAHRLWETGSLNAEVWPSPDGRHLAIDTFNTSCNMSMMENF